MAGGIEEEIIWGLSDADWGGGLKAPERTSLTRLRGGRMLEIFQFSR